MDINIKQKIEEIKKIFFSFLRVLIVILGIALGWSANELYHRYNSGIAGIEIKEPISVTDIIVAFDQDNNLIIIRDKLGKNNAVSFAPDVVESIYNMWSIRKWAKTQTVIETDTKKTK